MTEYAASAPRWHQRLDTLGRALARLSEATAWSRERPLSDLEREGLVQRFEFTWELAWKAMRDYLLDAGLTLDAQTPAGVIRAAFAAGLIADGDGWMAARAARNQMAHEYDRTRFEAIVAAIVDRYHPLIVELEQVLVQRRASGN